MLFVRKLVTCFHFLTAYAFHFIVSLLILLVAEFRILVLKIYSLSKQKFENMFMV